LGWVFGSAAVIFFVDLTVAGKWAVGVIGDFVLAFAIAQLIGILGLKAGPIQAATTPVV
jgi:hypothetical protein